MTERPFLRCGSECIKAPRMTAWKVPCERRSQTNAMPIGLMRNWQEKQEMRCFQRSQRKNVATAKSSRRCIICSTAAHRAKIKKNASAFVMYAKRCVNRLPRSCKLRKNTKNWQSSIPSTHRCFAPSPKPNDAMQIYCAVSPNNCFADKKHRDTTCPYVLA